jgi:hypothetical protein
MANAPNRPPPAKGDLGAGVPANVDLRKLGQKDNPQEDWGEAPEAETQHGANHTVRPDRSELITGQGRKTRTANKDIVSRRNS